MQNVNVKMLYPGYEPGLPRPQRGVLTTRLIEHTIIYIIYIINYIYSFYLEMPGFDPGASRLQSARSTN